MATRLTLKTETNYRDLTSDSKDESITIIEEYVEGESDTICWRLECMARMLLSEGYSIDLVNKYLNYENGEVFEIEESYSKHEVD